MEAQVVEEVEELAEELEEEPQLVRIDHMEEKDINLAVAVLLDNM